MSENGNGKLGRKFWVWVIGTGLVVLLGLAEASIRLWKPAFAIPAWCPTVIVALVGVYIGGNAATHWAYGRSNNQTKQLPAQGGQ